MMKTRLIVLAAILACAVAVIFWWTNACEGTFPAEDCLPDTAMLAHIIEHAEELAAADVGFQLVPAGGDDMTLYYREPDEAGGVDLHASLLFTPGAVDELRDPATVPIDARGYWERQDISMILDFPAPWTTCYMVMWALYDHCAFQVSAGTMDVSAWPMQYVLNAAAAVIGMP